MEMGCQFRAPVTKDEASILGMIFLSQREAARGSQLLGLDATPCELTCQQSCE